MMKLWEIFIIEKFYKSLVNTTSLRQTKSTTLSEQVVKRLQFPIS